MDILLSAIVGAATLLGDSPSIPTGEALTNAQAGVETVFGNESKKAWETFHRPLNAARTSGDSWLGAGIIRATKVVD